MKISQAFCNKAFLSLRSERYSGVWQIVNLSWWPFQTWVFPARATAQLGGHLSLAISFRTERLETSPEVVSPRQLVLWSREELPLIIVQNSSWEILHTFKLKNKVKKKTLSVSNSHRCAVSVAFLIGACFQWQLKLASTWGHPMFCSVFRSEEKPKMRGTFSWWKAEV